MYTLSWYRTAVVGWKAGRNFKFPLISRLSYRL
jgi:hypothetical protein